MDDEEGPQNENPQFVNDFLNTALEFVQTYGWFIVLGVALIVYLINRYRPQLQQWQEQRETSSYKKMDAGVALDRMEAMERARQRMQAQFDEQAKEFAEKQKIKDEEKRQARLEDYQRYQEGKGYRSKVRTKEEEAGSATGATATSASKPKPKKPLRGDYNPLMGDMSGGACYRPPRRGGAGGGG